MKRYIGCDLGGTNLRAALVDIETGTVLFQQSVPTLAREGHDAVMQRMADLFLTMIKAAGLQTEDVGGIGIGVPGVLDLEKGETLFLPNLPGTWPHVPLRDVLYQATGLPVALLNDVRSITFGEWRFGAGQGVDTVAVLAIGTGIGGGLVINGQLHLGIGGTAGELGHMVIDFNGPRCGCGNYGCLEAFASGPAIAAMGMKAVAQGLTTKIGELCGYDLNAITPALIAEAALQGDEIAREIYQQVGFYLGVAASSLCASVSPRRIIVTGGVANAGRLLLDPMEKTMRERVHIMPVEQVEIVPGQLGDHAGVVGAACWAANRLG
ncbi:glucokinase [Bellilinea caldifistulae]|uniref:ROK family transcriptional regulator n=1 Tax=Bellilinea caldifistulae TaxID=360411 RepID=A0A0N8GLW6_9CHLR|nr:ROK family protein [Bellilinea caldifistulae]KPL73642.1 ROK family transcriptional regulator [Bellilinea caldifistulae]GAP10280.1 glucokinase [Bellilinea caldifistulae]GIV65362.1 MAG: glucokinase [Bellilinea sp.]